MAKQQRGTTEILKAIPLGGHGEIGKNCWVFETKGEIVIVNYGMLLPPHNLNGIDLILPNIEYLISNQEKIKGLILTSAHDDSCGGVFYLLNKVKIPQIWGSKLALECMQSLLKKNISVPEVKVMEPRKVFEVGSQFTIEPIRNTATLPDTYGLNIQTEAGNILYTGSYKIDQTPPDKVLYDYYSYSKAGEDGVDLLISDSTNIETLGYSQSEKIITKRFNEIFSEKESRIVILTYASNVHKQNIIFKLAEKHNKKVLLCGEYLISKIDAAIKAGFINVDKDLFIQSKDLEKYKDSEIIILITGPYGNFLTALMELAKEEHPTIKLKSKDIIVVSANPPPGTARILAHTVDQLFVQKVQVIGGQGQGVHVSGHAAQEEAKFILTVAKPRSFVPSHGEERQLVTYSTIAEMMNINSNDIHILSNGDVLELREQVARIANKIPAQSIYYNYAQDLAIDELTMKERQTLSLEGTITVAMAVNEERNIIAGPEIIAEACSFAKGKDWRAFCMGVVEAIKEAINKSVENKEKDISAINSAVTKTVNKMVLEFIGKRPLINISIQEVSKQLKQETTKV